jgi:prepilin-type N-terminal cleavage/methylation domain-containing protein
MTTRRDSRGFSLLELMAVLAIMSVLSTVAIFSYKSYIRKARVGEGVAFLMDIKMKQETYFMTYSRYVDTGAGPNDFFPDPMPFVPYPWVTGLGTWDCANPSGDAIRGFCALGISPTTPDTWFQYVTLGWAPGDALPPASPQGPWIRDGSRRWWFARARGYLQTGAEISYEMRLSSELNEIVEITQ